MSVIQQISKPDYRGDVDGLRAIAIMCALIFHANPAALSGGYVGVDMFLVISGYLICTKQVRTIKGDMMGFSDFIDVKGEFFDVTMFPDTFMKYPLTGVGIYRMAGKVANDFGVPSLEVQAIERLGYVGDPRRE